MSKSDKLVGVLSDIHVPFHDIKATKLALEYLSSLNLDMLVLLGDIADFLAISRYGKSLKRKAMLKEELEQCVDFLAEVRRLFPKTKIKYAQGNHEARWNSYIENHAEEFGQLDFLQLPQVLQLQKLKIDWVPNKFTYNGMIFYHGDGKCSRNGGYTVTAWMQHFMQSCIIGHIHRQAVIYKRFGTGQTMVGVENPCLAQMDPDYDKGGTSNWQHGGTVLQMNISSHVNHPRPFIIHGSKLYGNI